MDSDASNSCFQGPLEWIYPQRCRIGSHYELWRFPYVKDGVLEDEPDFVLVLLNGTRNEIHLFTGFVERTQDRDYLARILWLIHDISNEFDMQFHVLEDWERWDPEEDVPYFEALARAFVGT